MTRHRLVIIGAGLAGLTAAAEVVQTDGWSADDVVLVEREADVGGRLMTEEVGGATYDHGAQFFTVRTEPFEHRVAGWIERGWVAEWCRGFGEVDGYPRYRGVGGMRSLAAQLAADLQQQGVHVITGAEAELNRDADCWVVSGAGDELSSHEEVRALFREMVDEEKHHQELVQAELDKLPPEDTSDPRDYVDPPVAH